MSRLACAICVSGPRSAPALARAFGLPRPAHEHATALAHAAREPRCGHLPAGRPFGRPTIARHALSTESEEEVVVAGAALPAVGRPAVSRSAVAECWAAWLAGAEP